MSLRKPVAARTSRRDRNSAQPPREPAPPFPKQHQTSPGLEVNLKPAPRYEAPEYKAAGKLKGKAALITGGDSGIGRAVATLYAREGARVAISYLPEEQRDAEEAQQSIEAEGGKCVLIPGDLTDAGMNADDVAKFGADSPMGRPAQPEELAPAFVFLASSADSSYITGIVLQVMGGKRPPARAPSGFSPCHGLRPEEGTCQPTMP